MRRLTTSRKSERPSRLRGTRGSGFTLIELLVVIGIILLLSGFTLAVYNSTISGDRIRSASRTVQSFLLGARDRATQAQAFRGLRLMSDPSNSNIVRSFQYIRPIDRKTYGLHSIQLERADADGDPYATPNDATSSNITIVRGLSVDWLDLNSRGLLSYPPRIRIPSGSGGTWYTFTNVANSVVTNPSPPPATITTTTLQLTTPFQSTSGAAAHPAQVAFSFANGTYSTCELELANQLLENSQPLLLPSGAVIQLNRSSNVPSDWTSNPNARDLMFSPRGSITGPIAAGGPIYFYIADRQDAEQNKDPADPTAKGDKLILAIFPQTGLVATFPVDVTDTSPNDGIADDPFAFAKKGAVAGR